MSEQGKKVEDQLAIQQSALVVMQQQHDQKVAVISRERDDFQTEVMRLQAMLEGLSAAHARLVEEIRKANLIITQQQTQTTALQKELQGKIVVDLEKKPEISTSDLVETLIEDLTSQEKSKDVVKFDSRNGRKK